MILVKYVKVKKLSGIDIIPLSLFIVWSSMAYIFLVRFCFVLGYTKTKSLQKTSVIGATSVWLFKYKGSLVNMCIIGFIFGPN